MTAFPYTFDPPLPISSDFEALILEAVAESEWAEFHPPRPELARDDLRWLHNQAILIARMFEEFFPGVARPSGCVFDARPTPKPGTLAGLMQSGRMP